MATIAAAPAAAATEVQDDIKGKVWIDGEGWVSGTRAGRCSCPGLPRRAWIMAQPASANAPEGQRIQFTRWAADKRIVSGSEGHTGARENACPARPFARLRTGRASKLYRHGQYDEIRMAASFSELKGPRGFLSGPRPRSPRGSRRLARGLSRSRGRILRSPGPRGSRSPGPPVRFGRSRS